MTLATTMSTIEKVRFFWRKYVSKNFVSYSIIEEVRKDVDEILKDKKKREIEHELVKAQVEILIEKMETIKLNVKLGGLKDV